MVTNGPPIPKMRRGKPPKRNGRPSIARLTLEPITPLYAYIARKTNARDTSPMHVIVSYNRTLYNEKCVGLIVVRRRLCERRISKDLLIFTFIFSLFFDR